MNDKPERNGCLTAILYAGLVISVFKVMGTMQILNISRSSFLHGQIMDLLKPMAMVGLATSVLLIYGFLAVIFHRRWGVFLVVGSYVLGALANMSMGGLGWGLTGSLIVIALLLILMYFYLLPEWSTMD